MSKLLEEYNNYLNNKYHKTLKKLLNKQHNTNIILILKIFK